MNTIHQVKKIVFLVYWPITAYEEEKWHLNYLRSQGFEVEVFDLNYLLNNKSVHNINLPHALQGDFIRRISTYQELEDLLEKLAGNSLFIDYLANHSDVFLKVEKVFRLLKKHKAQYIFISSGALPMPSLFGGKFSAINMFILKARKSVNPSKLLNFIARKWILFLTRHNMVYPLPVLIFGAPSETLMRYIANRNISREKVISVHSFDYDTYLYYQRNLANKSVPVEDICVFLDEAATNHFDFALLGLRPVAAQEYFASMNRLFDFIEQTTGLQVVIAAHPRSNYELMPSVFGGRPIIKGKSVELTAKSQLVVMHTSTSVDFAILFKKPVVVVKTIGIREDARVNMMVDTMASSLGVQPLDIDDDQFPPPSLNININYKKYEEYLYKYIKSPGVEDIPVWEIVSSAVKKLDLSR